MVKIGLALSGGGARGVAHLGLISALEELGIQPSVISGVSAGAIIGAFYAAGYAPAQILALAKEHAGSGIAQLGWFRNGIFSSSGLRRLLTSCMPSTGFSELRIPVLVVATDLVSGTPVVLSDGSICDALMGSAAVPGIFNPVKCGSYYLVDGGVMNNFPVESLKGKCDKIIGCHVNRMGRSLVPEKLNKLYVIEKCFHLAIANTIAGKSSLCDIFLEPGLEAYSIFDMKHADEIYQIGYRSAMTQKDLLLSWVRGEETKYNHATL